MFWKREAVHQLRAWLPYNFVTLKGLVVVSLPGSEVMWFTTRATVTEPEFNNAGLMYLPAKTSGTVSNWMCRLVLSDSLPTHNR